MANIKITELSAATAPDLDDEVEIVEDGNSRRATVAQIIAAAFVNTAPTLGWYSPSADLIRTPNAVTIDDALIAASLFANGKVTALAADGIPAGLFKGFSTNTASIVEFQREDAAVSSAIGYNTGDGAISFKTTTNHDLWFGANSVEVIRLKPSGEIQYGKALVSLGGGSAPTFGTIGGSGPATAGQNSWVRLLDSTGAAFWVPAWK
jgi:hypothetical protein